MERSEIYRRTSKNPTALVSLVVSFSLLALVACMGWAFPNAAPIKKDSVSLNANEWYFNHCSGMPDHPFHTDSGSGAWSFTFPQSMGYVAYLATPYWPTKTHSMLSMTFRVDASRDAVYNGRVDPNNTDPGTLYLFLERYGDNGAKEYYRWWARPIVYVLGSEDNSIVTMKVPLRYDNWTSVHGHYNRQEFEDTLNDLGYVGMTFGGSSFFGHGLNMRGGTATFTLIDYEIN